MKTVTIPTCANPFVVIVNGIKYTYPAGATVEVPDDVAEVIEQHEEAKPEPAPVQPPFASVPSSGESGGGASGGGGLPVVELETNLTAEGSAMSASDNAKLSAAIGGPAIISINHEKGTSAFLCSYYSEEPFRMFACSIGVLGIVLQTMDGETWSGQLVEM